MCELLYLRRTKPFYLAEVFPFAVQADLYGIAGFGWGVAWVDEHGTLDVATSSGSLRKEYDMQMKLASKRVKSCVFHLRRPSFFSTLTIENAQPYLASREFAFAHNGFLANSQTLAQRYEEHRIGQSDSEVGFLMYADYRQKFGPIIAMDKMLNDAIGDGSANVMVLETDGGLIAAGRNRVRNRMFYLSGDGFSGVATEMHSQDGNLMRIVYPKFEVGDEITQAVRIN